MFFTVMARIRRPDLHLKARNVEANFKAQTDQRKCFIQPGLMCELESIKLDSDRRAGAKIDAQRNPENHQDHSSD